VPLVSVVIPCYNQGKFLADALHSVLSQTFPAVEIVVVNDGSTDDTEAVAARFPGVRCVTQANRGLSGARNRGLAECRGELVIFLDADDRLLPGAIDVGVRALAEAPSAAFAAGRSRFISRDGALLPTEHPSRDGANPYLVLLRRNSIRNPATVVFRRTVLERVGGFAPSVDACADYEIYLRLSRQYPVRFHETVVAEYRKHDESMSLDAGRMLRELRVVMKAQGPYISGGATRTAYREGIQRITSYYGNRLIAQIRARVRRRLPWRQTAADIVTLLQWDPRGALRHGLRKMSLWGSHRLRAVTPRAVTSRRDPARADANSQDDTPNGGRRRTPLRTPAETPATPAPNPGFAAIASDDRTGRE
jgi:glycosyltransferase involved in cell wall biosynthesis